MTDPSRWTSTDIAVWCRRADDTPRFANLRDGDMIDRPAHIGLRHVLLSVAVALFAVFVLPTWAALLISGAW